MLSDNIILCANMLPVKGIPVVSRDGGRGKTLEW
jgi:hypothetical protein